MPNIEIKARCSDLAKAKRIAEKIKTDTLGSLHQIDTYFDTASGQLKLREIPGQGAWLIPYVKTYEKNPARSDYQLLEAKDPEAVKSLFSKLLGKRTVVDKIREVYLVDNVRVHLDEVRGIGSFIEFEAVFDIDTTEVRENETRKVKELMTTFGLTSDDLLTEGYVNMLEAQAHPSAWTSGPYHVSTDPKKLDLTFIHHELAQSYWAEAIPRSIVETSVKNSLCFGAFEISSNKQVGFARIVSDFATFAYLGDVFVTANHRGRGISKFLMQCISTHPRLQGLRRICLGTRDAHSLYKKFGFELIKEPQNWMEIKVPGIYLRESI